MEMTKQKKHKLKGKSLSQRIVFGIVFVIFAVYAASLIYTLLFALLNSLKTPREYLDSALALPKNWLFSNYATAFKELEVEGTGFFMMLLNSLWWSAGHVVIHMLVVTTFSYVLAKYTFKGRQILWWLNLALMMIPIYGTMAASYNFYSVLNFTNTPLMLVGATAAFGSTTLIVTAFFKNVPWSYAEAALMDGANHIRIYFTIMLPLALPIVGTMSLVQFISTWNDYMGPLIYLDSMPTLASGLYLYRIYSVDRKGNYPIYFAGLLLSLAPVFVLYTIFSDTIMQNVGIGGLKG